MYEITCPECRNTRTYPDVRDGGVVECGRCSAKLRPTVSDEPAPRRGFARAAGPLMTVGAGGIGVLLAVVAVMFGMPAAPRAPELPPPDGEKEAKQTLTELVEAAPKRGNGWGGWRGKDKGGKPKTDPTARVEELRRKLTASAYVSRADAAKGLGKIGPQAVAASMDLLRLLRDPNQHETVKIACVDALESIGPPGVENTKYLLEAVADAKSTEARRYAAKFLTVCPEDRKKDVLKALAGALKDEDAAVRTSAVASLGKYGRPAYDEAYKDIVACLRDREEPVRKKAHDVLKTVGLPEEVDPAEAKELLDGDKDGQKPTAEARYWGVLLTVKKLPDKGTGVLAEAFEKDANFKDAVFTLFVVGQLREARLNNPDVARIVSKALDHADDAVCREALLALEDLDLAEHTFEAYLKAFANGEKLKTRLSRGGRVPDFAAKFRPALSTFGKGSGLKFKVTPALGEELCKTAKTGGEFPRLFAICSLGTVGRETPEAGKALAEALVKEMNAEIRDEIFAALASIGPPAGSAFVENAAAGRELDKWIGDGRDDTRHTQLLAALAKAAMNTDQEKATDAYRSLAKALMLKNAPAPEVVVTRWWRPTLAMRTRPTASSRDLELHQRAKEALAQGGVVAAKAICSALDTTFQGNGRIDTPAVTIDKLQARVASFKALAKIGPVLKDFKVTEKGVTVNPVRKHINAAFKNVKALAEDATVYDAAKEAEDEIFKK